MCDHAGLTIPKKEMTFVNWLFMGAKKNWGGSLPCAERSDGTFMNETQPIARYIARHNGYYPTDPIEQYWCDYWTNMYEPIIFNMNLLLGMFGSAKKVFYRKVVDEIIPTALKKA